MPQSLFQPKQEEKPEEKTGTIDSQLIVIDASESFSKQALITLENSLKLSASLNAEQVTPLHLLKTLLGTQEVRSLLTNLNIDKQSLESSVSSLQTKQSKTPEIIILSPSVKKILLLAHQIATKNQASRVENSHLFFATLLLPEVAETLGKFNIDLSKIENFLNTNKSKAPQETPSLNKLSEDLTTKSLSSKGNLIIRQGELESLVRILLRRGHSNILLLGEPGVGKTSLIESLATSLHTFDSPTLQNARVKLLDVPTLFSSPENINRNCPKIIEEASLFNGKIILVFDKISFLQNSSQVQALNNFLQQLLKHENTSMILVANTSFYNEYLKQSSLISNYFEKITLAEPNLETTLEILKIRAPQIESYHNFKFENSALPIATDLAKRYITSSFLPQKAIDLLEEAAGQASLNKQKTITGNDIKLLVSAKTGIPLNDLSVSEKEKLTNLENILSASVIGQEEAVKAVAQAIRRSRAGLKDTRKPIGSFLFLGPTGVGKTELAKTLAKTIYNDEKAFVRLDMSEFSEPHTTQRLVGAPPGYVGYDEGGQLTNPIIEKPYSLILLDEIEKAHPKVFDIFLQILDDGRLTDSQGRTVDFKNTIIIATSNIASDKLFALKGEELKSIDRKKLFDELLLPELLNYFRPEFINRFDEIVVFNPLTPKELVLIARIKLSQLEQRLKEKNITLQVSDSKLEELVKASYDPSFGARPLERMLRDKLENEIAKKLIDGSLMPGSTITWG